MRSHHPAIRDSSRPAFTLIEILVVIGIVAILMGIAIAVGARVQDSGKVKATRDMLIALEATSVAATAANKGQILPPYVAEPRVYTNRSDMTALVWLPVADARWKRQGGNFQDPIINSVGLFLWQARQFPEAAKLIESLPTRYMKLLELDEADVGPIDINNLQGQPPLVTAMDAWGNPIRYVHPALDGPFYGNPAAPARLPGEYTAFATLDVILPNPNVVPTPEFLFTEVRRNATRLGDPATDPSLAADSDGGTCIAGRPYFYSSGPDGDPSTTDDNVYLTLPNLPKKR